MIRRLWGGPRDFRDDPEFGCAENGYPPLRTKSGAMTARYGAKACRPWFENRKIPQKLIGRRMQGSVGVNNQLDRNYDIAGFFPSSKSPVFVK